MLKSYFHHIQKFLKHAKLTFLFQFLLNMLKPLSNTLKDLFAYDSFMAALSFNNNNYTTEHHDKYNEHVVL